MLSLKGFGVKTVDKLKKELTKLPEFSNIDSTKAQGGFHEYFKNWAKNNPQEYQAWQEKLISSRTTPETNDKRSASLKEWIGKNPEKANANARKRANAAAAKLSKEVCMIDLQSGEVLKTFPSQQAAAKWLVESGKAKNLNCVSSISSVCLRKPCTTGYGYRKKAYGYDWRFASEIQIKS